MSTKQLKADHFPREFYTYFIVCNRFQLVSFFLVNINFLTEFEKIEFLSSSRDIIRMRLDLRTLIQ